MGAESACLSCFFFSLHFPLASETCGSGAGRGRSRWVRRSGRESTRGIAAESEHFALSFDCHALLRSFIWQNIAPLQVNQLEGEKAKEEEARNYMQLERVRSRRVMVASKPL